MYAIRSYYDTARIELNEEQAQALALIRSAAQAADGASSTVLVQGVTGSGKTEVYMRARWTEQAAGIELPPRVTAVPVDAGGVPAEWIRAGAGGDGAVVYFHGGGYVVGSIATHRFV